MVSGSSLIVFSSSQRSEMPIIEVKEGYCPYCKHNGLDVKADAGDGECCKAHVWLYDQMQYLSFSTDPRARS